MAFTVGESGTVTLKAVLIGVIVLLLLVPLAMLRGLVSERAGLREQAYMRVAQGWGGNAVLGGPMLVVPTLRTVVEKINDKEVSRVVRSDLYLLPARLDMNVALELQDEPRYVGIYAVPVYLADVQFKGEFEFAALQPLLDKPGVTYLWHQGRLRLPVSEVRSLREVGQARFAGADVKLGPAQPGIYRGIEAACRSHRAGEERVGRFRIPRRRRRQPCLVTAAARQHDDAAIAFELAASVVLRRIPAGRAHDHRKRFRRALAGARAESLLSTGVQRGGGDGDRPR